MPTIPAKKLKGFQDLDAAAMQIKRHLLTSVQKQASLADFQQIDTPSLEYAQTLLGTSGETDKQVFRFQDNGKRDVALRFDLTIPFARYIAEHQGTLVFPFKGFQIGKVWRAEKPQKGRYREFMQCDLDIIGVESMWADIEILSVFYKIFAEDIKLPFTISIGQRAVVSALIKKILGTKLAEDKVLIAIDKLQKIGQDNVLALLEEQLNVPCKQGKELLNLISQEDLDGEISKAIKDMDEASISFQRYKDTVQSLKQTHNDTVGQFKADLSIVRGLGYYTGIVFETNLNNKQDFGSVCSGGRYDNLIDRFTTQKLMGIGGSIGIDRLLLALQEDDQWTQTKNNTVFIAIAQDSARDYAHNILTELRKNNISSTMDLKEQKIANQFKYANRMNYPFVIALGEKEVNNQTFCLKDMATGIEEKDLPLAKLIDCLSKYLKGSIVV